MRRGWTKFGTWVATAIAWATAAACSAPPGDLASLELAGLALQATRSVWTPDTLKVRFEVRERFGGAEESEAFGRVGAVAADASGRLAIFDDSDCSVLLLSADRRSRRRLGRCGDGPGEFRRVVTLALHGDELLVLSYAAIQRIDTTGTERLRIDLGKAGLVGAAGIVPVDDSIVVIAAGVTGNEKDSVRSAMLVAMDSRSGTVLKRVVRPPLISSTNPEVRGDYLEICGGRSSAGRVVALAQAWALQTVVLEAGSLTPVSNFVTTSEWTGGVRPVVPGRSQPSLRPRLRARAIQCLASGTATWGRKTDWTQVPPANVGSLLELRLWDGRVVYRGGNPNVVPPNAIPSAAWSDNLVYFTNEGVPEVVVVAVTPKPVATNAQ